eukprot:s3780_g9.t1
MGRVRKRSLLWVVISLWLQHFGCPISFSTPNRAKNWLPRRALPPGWAAQAAEAFRDPSVQAVSAALIRAQTVVNFVASFDRAGKVWSEWIKLGIYDGTGDVADHVSQLIQSMKQKLQAQNNTIISSTQSSKLPEEPVRNTYIEQLMVATLLNSTPGMSAVYAESGTGKSVAATLAITAVASDRVNDAFVLLQGNLNQRLRAFLRIADESLTDDIAEPFFRALREEDIELHVIFDNVLDSGVPNDAVQDNLKSLARAACEHQHQIIFTMQTREAAESVRDMNGDTTRIAPQQDEAFGAYRWQKNETRKLIAGLRSAKQPDLILKESEIPDDLGRWRPRATKLFASSGLKPAPQSQRRQVQAGFGTTSTSVWVRELAENKDGTVTAKSLGD